MAFNKWSETGERALSETVDISISVQSGGEKFLPAKYSGINTTKIDGGARALEVFANADRLDNVGAPGQYLRAHSAAARYDLQDTATTADASC